MAGQMGFWTRVVKDALEGFEGVEAGFYLFLLLLVLLVKPTSIAMLNDLLASYASKTIALQGFWYKLINLFGSDGAYIMSGRLPAIKTVCSED
jgi:hypothetical protein